MEADGGPLFVTFRVFSDYNGASSVGSLSEWDEGECRNGARNMPGRRLEAVLGSIHCWVQCSPTLEAPSWALVSLVKYACLPPSLPSVLPCTQQRPHPWAGIGA